MPGANRGEVWMADLGMRAKVRPVQILSVDYQGEKLARSTRAFSAASR